MIVLKDVEKEFVHKKVLKNLSFHIAPGEKVGVIGLNGAGKSTLMNVIAGIIKPDKGFIRVNGVESPLKHYHVLRNMAYISGTSPRLWENLPLEKFYFENGVLRVVFDKQKIETTQLIKHMMAKCKVKDIKIKEPDLEDTIKKVYERKV